MKATNIFELNLWIFFGKHHNGCLHHFNCTHSKRIAIIRERPNVQFLSLFHSMNFDARFETFGRWHEPKINKWLSWKWEIRCVVSVYVFSAFHSKKKHMYYISNIVIGVWNLKKMHCHPNAAILFSFMDNRSVHCV